MWRGDDRTMRYACKENAYNLLREKSLWEWQLWTLETELILTVDLK
jgi:hypothetical protein